MKVLITNTQCAQAYSIIRSLRPFAEKIVVTMSGKYRFQARTAHAANSRLVDKRYYVPRSEKDWQAGIIQRENTEREERYLQRIEEICRREKIDTIFPSYDPEVYIFSKNKERFAKLGVHLVVQDFDLLMIPLDKYKSYLAAKKAGYPVPVTVLPQTDADLEEILDTQEPPWVIKPRLSANSKGTNIVSEKKNLIKVFRETEKEYQQPMVQELVPGRERQNFYVICDGQSNICSFVAPEVVRIGRRLFRNSSMAALITSTSRYQSQIQKICKDLKWWGGLTVQAKIDARDGLPKLMEINPRFGRHLWYRTESGINEPLMILKLSRGEAVPEFTNYQNGAITLEPLDDLLNFVFEFGDLALFNIRKTIFRKKPADIYNLPPSVSEMFKAYARDYFNRRKKIITPYTRYLLSDPLVCILWYYAMLGDSLRTLNHRAK